MVTFVSDEQIKFFKENGYLHIPNAIGAKELEQIRRVADEFVAMEKSAPEEWTEDFKSGSLVGDPESDEDMSLCRLEYPLGKSRELLALVAHPCVLELAYKLHGVPSILTWEDMIIKVPKVGVSVPFHQDLLYQSVNSTVFSIGVYIDDSGGSPLMAIPGTQRLGPLPEDEVAGIVDSRSSELVTLNAMAGDIVVHNVLMLHGSGPNKGANPRRVIYFEFRTLRQLETDSPWGPNWINTRAKYVPAAIRVRRMLNQATDEESPVAAEWERTFAVDEDTLTKLDFRVHHDDLGN
ncbi:phytanoyl-CoA dioxygenase family protein [Notoacmeibacter marinus]|uniref:phytanoyl-CoA dioxygenase family protein n=1 Tax=Notoacmeibacter marinus TaxID=1876515 RepID=UPI000DF3B3B4|nr:phytanoyl-CoA dioxygenase family protein [Notoacmeibacter marinus]